MASEVFLSPFALFRIIDRYFGDGDDSVTNFINAIIFIFALISHILYYIRCPYSFVTGLGLYVFLCVFSLFFLGGMSATYQRHNHVGVGFFFAGLAFTMFLATYYAELCFFVGVAVLALTFIGGLLAVCASNTSGRKVKAP